MGCRLLQNVTRCQSAFTLGMQQCRPRRTTAILTLYPQRWWHQGGRHRHQLHAQTSRTRQLGQGHADLALCMCFFMQQYLPSTSTRPVRGTLFESGYPREYQNGGAASYWCQYPSASPRPVLCTTGPPMCDVAWPCILQPPHYEHNLQAAQPPC
jgi:hypothetical protein